MYSTIQANILKYHSLYITSKRVGILHNGHYIRNSECQTNTEPTMRAPQPFGPNKYPIFKFRSNYKLANLETRKKFSGRDDEH